MLTIFFIVGQKDQKKKRHEEHQKEQRGEQKGKLRFFDESLHFLVEITTRVKRKPMAPIVSILT